MAAIWISNAANFGVGLNWQGVLAVCALAGAGIAFARMTMAVLVVAMFLATISNYSYIVAALPATALGRWTYSQVDFWTIPGTLLPILALVTALLADGRAQRGMATLRRSPNEESV